MVFSILLKDIDLDLPYQKNDGNIQKLMDMHSVTEAQAVRLDYEQNWKQKRILFRDQVRCIASLYTCLLGRFSTENTKKLIINCMEEPIDEVQTTRDGFTEVSVELNIESYLNLSNYEKKKMILEKIQDGVMLAASEYSWDRGIFNRVHARIQELNYENEYVWKRKLSPSRKLSAEVFCEHDLDSFTATLIIKDNESGEMLKSKKVLQERPHELIFTQYLGELRWNSDQMVQITYRGKKSKWLAEDIRI
jgi:hypothetical protein